MSTPVAKQGLDELGILIGRVLPVPVHLHARVESMLKAYLKSGLDGAADSQIDGQLYHHGPLGFRVPGGIVPGAVVDDDYLIARRRVP